MRQDDRRCRAVRGAPLRRVRPSIRPRGPQLRQVGTRRTRGPGAAPLATASRRVRRPSSSGSSRSNRSSSSWNCASVTREPALNALSNMIVCAARTQAAKRRQKARTSSVSKSGSSSRANIFRSRSSVCSCSVSASRLGSNGLSRNLRHPAASITSSCLSPIRRTCKGQSSGGPRMGWSALQCRASSPVSVRPNASTVPALMRNS
jgi:hypothetical protein